MADVIPFPISVCIDPDTSHTGRTLSTDPSIKLGRDFHCSFARSESPYIRFLVTS